MTDAHPHALRSVILLLAALFLFVLLDATAKRLAASYPVPMLVWARYAVHFVLMVVFLAPSMRLKLVTTARPGRQIVRAACLLAVTFLNIAALQQMPLAETFFSPRFGMVADRFGISWMVYVAPVNQAS